MIDVHSSTIRFPLAETAVESVQQLIFETVQMQTCASGYGMD